LLQFHDIVLVNEYMTAFWRNLEASSGEQSLQYFLRRRFMVPGSLLVKRLVVDPYRLGLILNIDTERQWISELSAIFNKAMYWQKISTIAIVRNTIDRSSNTPWKVEKWSLCNKILFIDGDFININWTGGWITVGVLLLLCAISCGISLLEFASRKNVTWQLLRSNTAKWIEDELDKLRAIGDKTDNWMEEAVGKMRTDTSRWKQKMLDNVRGMRMNTGWWTQRELSRLRRIPHQDIPVNLDTLSTPAQQSVDEEPDDPIPQVYRPPGR
jgi:hypothetical protein